MQKIPASDLVAMAARAAEYFINDALPLDPESGTMQTPQEYVEQVTATFFTQFLPSSAYPIRPQLRALVAQALVD